MSNNEGRNSADSFGDYATRSVIRATMSRAASVHVSTSQIRKANRPADNKNKNERYANRDTQCHLSISQG